MLHPHRPQPALRPSQRQVLLLQREWSLTSLSCRAHCIHLRSHCTTDQACRAQVPALHSCCARLRRSRNRGEEAEEEGKDCGGSKGVQDIPEGGTDAHTVGYSDAVGSSMARCICILPHYPVGAGRWSKKLSGRRQGEQPDRWTLEKPPRAVSIRCKATSCWPLFLLTCTHCYLGCLLLFTRQHDHVVGSRCK